MKKKYIIIGSIVGVILLSLASFFIIKSNKIGNKKIKAEKYTIPERQKVFIDGIVLPEKTKEYFGDPTKGKVDKISVKNGQYVKKGEVLFTYKNDTVSNQIDEIERQVNGRKKERRLMKEKQDEIKRNTPTANSDSMVNSLGGDQGQKILAQNNASSKLSNIESKYSFTTIDNQIEELNNQIENLKDKEYTKVISEFEGTVYVNEESAQKNQPLVSVQTNKLYVKGKVSERDIQKIKLKDKVEVLILHNNKTLKGSISKIDLKPIGNDVPMPNMTQGGQANLSYYNVDMKLDSTEGILEGFHVQSTVNLGDSKIKIPKTSVINENGSDFTYKVVDGKTVKTKVVKGKEEGNDVIISSGISYGDTIIKEVNSKMKEGEQVE